MILMESMSNKSFFQLGDDSSVGTLSAPGTESDQLQLGIVKTVAIHPTCLLKRANMNPKIFKYAQCRVDTSFLVCHMENIQTTKRNTDRFRSISARWRSSLEANSKAKPVPSKACKTTCGRHPVIRRKHRLSSLRNKKRATGNCVPGICCRFVFCKQKPSGFSWVGVCGSVKFSLGFLRVVGKHEEK